MSIWQAILLAIVEGITEYLPISSTGHLILVSHIMPFTDPNFVTQFNIIVQFGAILSVIYLYWRRLMAPLSFYIKIGVGFLPAAVLGLLVKSKIDQILDSVTIVAVSLIVGGIVLILVDKNADKKLDKKSAKTLSQNNNEIEGLTYKSAFFIGLCQCLAFVPGVSRSAASILGGLFFGLNRKAAAEFSFFLAVPTLAGATFIKVLKIAPTISSDQIGVLVVGNIVSFVVGALAIKTFIHYLSQKSFFGFGVYRIVLGAIVLALVFL